jgi:hypothetical protein
VSVLTSLDITYTAEKTPAKFHASEAFVRGIMGPLGSGKSVACCIEIVRRAAEQQPNKHGVRKFRAAIIRNSYPELKTTTIKTWQDWFPESICKMNWGSPITGTMHIPGDPTKEFPDGTKIEMEVLFLALDRPKDVKKLLSMELTMAWINEARELPKEILDGVTSRVGRYPAKRDGGPTFTGVILDTNPPDDDHWWYTIAEVKRPEDWSFWRQPGALLKVKNEKDEFIYVPNPLAENVDNQPLGYRYWMQMIGGKSHEWLKVYVLGDYGTVYDGKPIYPEYNDSIHCAKENLEVMRGIPLMLGFDFGRTPAVALFQLSPTGQVRVIDEVVTEDMGVRNMIKNLLRPLLNNEYYDMRIRSWGDPSGGNGTQTTEDTCMTILAEEGIPTEPASTQEPVARREAVAKLLSSYDADGSPAFLLSPKCKNLRKGFNGAFMYERVQVVGEVRYKDQPKKNIYSHVHEGLQYGCLMIEEGLKVETVRAKPVRKRKSNGWAA